jgi:hypothetical protein
MDSAPSPTTAVRSTSTLIVAHYTSPSRPSRSSRARLTSISARLSVARTSLPGDQL